MIAIRTVAPFLEKVATFTEIGFRKVIQTMAFQLLELSAI